MRNISFDNPLLLLLIIPAVLLIVLPFVLSFGKTNKNRNSTASFILHLVIIVCVILAAAAPAIITVITKTQIIVLADVSHSSSRNLEEIDAYIKEMQGELPTNSQMGVVTFGKNQRITTPIGGDFVSVRGSGVDDSETNISDALNYAATLFDDSAIKRIVLITDGKETDTNGKGKLIATIETLHDANVHLDAIYLDNNLTDEDEEVQVSDVSATTTAYLGRENAVTCLIQAANDCQAIVSLERDGVTVDSKATSLYKGYNNISFNLPTSVAGNYTYEVKVSSTSDMTEINNSMTFSQQVVSDLEVLLISWSYEDLSAVEAKYGDTANITSYIQNPKIPCTIEEICKYDEIILSNVDIRLLSNYSAFIDSLDKAVSIFGKSLLTMGDLYIQNKDDPALQKLEEMLPVTYGNGNRENKFYIIVVDSSNSMSMAMRLIMAKQAATTLLDIFNEGDFVGIVNFWGDLRIAQAPVEVTEKELLLQAIESIEPHQGTMISAAVKEAGKLLEELPDGEKHIILISDGYSSAIEEDTPDALAAQLYEDYEVYTSVINPYSESEGTAVLEKIAQAGHGDYFLLENSESLEDLILKDVADQITESLIQDPSSVNVDIPTDSVLNGISSLPIVDQYLYTQSKGSATVPLTVNYHKTEKVVMDLPLYAYQNFGNGRVATFTTSLTGGWTTQWQTSAEGNALFANILDTNTPKERIDYPYTLSITNDGTVGQVVLTPLEISAIAQVSIVVTPPDGRYSEGKMAFDGEKYTFSFNMTAAGSYSIAITYKNGVNTYKSTSFMNTSYAPEYNDFVIFDPSLLYATIRDRGTINEGVIPSLENDEKELATYVLRLTAALMAVAAGLYIVDIAVRKLKWNDIKSFFKPSRKKGGNRT